MILAFKQKMMSIAGKYEIYDEEGQIAYKIQGRVRVPKKYDIYNTQGEKLPISSQNTLTFCLNSDFSLTNRKWAELKENFRFSLKNSKLIAMTGELRVT